MKSFISISLLLLCVYIASSLAEDNKNSNSNYVRLKKKSLLKQLLKKEKRGWECSEDALPLEVYSFLNDGHRWFTYDTCDAAVYVHGLGHICGTYDIQCCKTCEGFCDAWQLDGTCNHGTCEVGSSDLYCDCDYGYSGDYCTEGCGTTCEYYETCEGNVCTCKDDEVFGCSDEDKSNCNNNAETLTDQERAALHNRCPVTCGLCCGDVLGETECAEAKRAGMCDKGLCAKTCGFCGNDDDDDGPTTPEVTTTPEVPRPDVVTTPEPEQRLRVVSSSNLESSISGSLPNM